MADEPKQPESQAPDAAPEPDQLFRLQVATSDFFVGNAKYFAYALVIGLVGIGVYGAVDGWRTSKREAAYGEIADIDYKMPKPAELAQFGLVPADDPNDPARIEDVTTGAKLYEERARATTGAPAVYAWLKAAETWGRLDKAEPRLAALRAAHAVGADGLPGHSAVMGLASALATSDQSEQAVAILTTYAAAAEGFYAEEALIGVAQLQVDAGKAVEAGAVVEEFRRRFPDSPRTARLSALVPGVAPASAPAMDAPTSASSGG